MLSLQPCLSLSLSFSLPLSLSFGILLLNRMRPNSVSAHIPSPFISHSCYFNSYFKIDCGSGLASAFHPIQNATGSEDRMNPANTTVMAWDTTLSYFGHPLTRPSSRAMSPLPWLNQRSAMSALLEPAADCSWNFLAPHQPPADRR